MSEHELDLHLYISQTYSQQQENELLLFCEQLRKSDSIGKLASKAIHLANYSIRAKEA